MKHQEQPRKRNGASTTDASAASSSNAKHKKKSKSKKQFYESDHDDNRGNDDNVQVIMEDLDMVAADEEKEERRRTKAERKRAEKALQKTKEHFAELGLDEDGNLLDHYSLLKYPVRECKFTLPFCGTEPIALNPVVTLIGLSCMWSIVVWSTVDPTGSLQALLAGRSYVALSYTWLFQASKALLCGFLVWIVYKYGHLHLGRNKNEQPEFTMRSWFAILFSSGTGPALLFYSVSETLYHQQSNYYANAGYHVQDEIDLFAVNMTVSNWTITTWLLFTIVAVCTSLAVHCFGLPLSFRSCFYPIFGAYTWGWMGDCIDGLAIVIMMLSTCCMLCLSSIQIVTGLLYMGWVDADSATANDITAMQKATVWIVTFVSTASVISGLHYGIQYMSLLATSLGFVLLFAIFILDDTKYLLNLQTQEVGYFLQNGFFQLNFWTDAFGQLRAGSGRAVDGKSAAEWWISSWIVMYQAWVVALSTVFGVFVARISKGRKLWELVVACFLVPSLALLIWFCIWGGIGLRQTRQGKELAALGETYFGNSGHFLKDGSDLCYDVPQHDVVVNETTIFTNYLPGVTPVCQFREEEAASAVFNVLYSFNYPESFGGGGLGPALSVLYLICCAIYYVTLSDSASLIVDNMASNGRKNNHWARRMLWASSVGALTSTLLSSGSGDALKAVESAVLVGSLPAAFLMCLMFQCITLWCRAADKHHSCDDSAPRKDDDAINEVDYEFPKQPEFSMPVYGGVLNVMEYILSLGRVNAARVELGMHRPTPAQVVEFVKGVLVPYVSLQQVLSATYPQNPRTNRLTVTFFALCYTVATVCWVLSWLYPGLTGVVCILLAPTGTTLGIVCAGVRHKYNIRSNYFADCMVSLFLWPQVVSQMRLYDDSAWVANDFHKKESKRGKSAKSRASSGRADSDGEESA